MKNMGTLRHINLLNGVPDGAAYKYGQFGVFLQSLDTCLTYHHDDYDIKPEADKDDPILACLVKDLYQQFFDHLYVERYERENLYELSFEKKVILFSGQAGTGKTTILSKLKEDINNHENNLVHYINLKKAIGLIGTKERHGKTVCEYVFEDFYRNILISAKNEELIDNYRIFRVQNHEAFSGLCTDIIEDLKVEEKSEWLDALNDEYYKGEEKRLRIEARGNPAYSHSNLAVLLKFLSSEFTDFKHVVLILDNIDRLKLPVQREVVQAATDIRDTHSIVIAIRTRNLEDIRRGDSSGAGGDIIRWEETMTAELQTGNDVIKNMIEKRIGFLRDYKTDHHIAGLAHLPDFEKLLQTVTNVKHCKVLAALDAWYNHSLRHIGSNMAMFIGRTLAGADPAHPLKKICPSGNCSGDLEVHNLRNSLFKFMVCDNQLTYDNSTGTKLLNIYSSNYAKDMLPFPEFAILKYIHHNNGRIEFGDLKTVFAKLGLSCNELIEIVKQLKRPQGQDGFGFLIVESKTLPRTSELENDDLLELLPTGEYFIKYLSVSCEYNFWMALDTETSTRMLSRPFKGSINYSDTEDDALRALISARFVLKHVLPLLEEAETLVETEESYRIAYRQIFPDKYAHLAAYVQSLLGFISHIINSSNDLKKKAKGEIEDIQRRIIS